MIKNLDLSYSYSDDLKMIPNNVLDMSSFIERELAEITQIQEKDYVQSCQRLGVVGNYLKMLGRLSEAHKIFEHIDDVIKIHNLDFKNHLVNQLRWADVKCYDCEFTSARSMFEESLILINSNPSLSGYKDFALQHFGKLFFDIKEYQNALNFFNEAMELRKLKKNEELIQSTEFAIKITLKKIVSQQKI